MKVIDLATTKAILGLTVTTYDAQITAQIPIIDAKVKQICRNNFNLKIAVSVTNTETEVSLTGASSNPEVMQLTNDLPVGTLLEGTGIVAGSYIAEVYYNGLEIEDYDYPTFTLSEAADDDSSIIYAGINIAYQTVIAKGIWWLIDNTSTNINNTGWISRSGATLSVSKSDADNKIDGASGMPAWFIKGLPRYHR